MLKKKYSLDDETVIEGVTNLMKAKGMMKSADVLRKAA